MIGRKRSRNSNAARVLSAGGVFGEVVAERSEGDGDGDGEGEGEASMMA
jgi:hypothetical protein